MTEPTSNDPPSGPILLCAGTDPAVAVRLAEAAVALLHHRPVVVLATWQPPPVMSGLGAAMDALGDVHAELRDVARRAAAQTAHAAADVLDAAGMHVTRQVCLEERSPWRMILDLAEEIDAAAIVAGTSEDAGHPPGSIGRQARALAHRARRPLLLLALTQLSSATRPRRCSPPTAPPRRTARRGSRVRCCARAERSSRALGSPSAMLSGRRGRDSGRGRPPGCGATRRGGAAARIRSGRRGRRPTRARGWSAQAVALEATRSVAATIVGAAEEHNAAVIVSGTRGRSRLSAALLGSTAESVLRHAGSPVLLVPPARDAD